MNSRAVNILNNRIDSLLFRFSAPAVAGMAAGALYNISDTIFVGRGSGPLAIAALSVVFPIQLIMMSAGTMIGIGGSSVISRSLGKNDRDTASAVLGGAVFLTLVLGMLLSSASYLFMDRILMFFGASSQVMPYAREYLATVLIGFLFYSFSITGSNLIRAEGNPRYAMHAVLIGALGNIVLDPVFILFLGMGIKGAAVATVISQCLSCFYIIAYYLRNKSILAVDLRGIRLNFPVIREILAVGFPSFLRSSMSSIVILLFNRVLSSYGNDLYIAVMGIGFRLLSLIQMPIIGLTQGFSTIASFNYGARQVHRVKKVLGAAVLWTTLIAAAGFIAVMFFTRPILGFFSDSPLIINMGIVPLRAAAMFLPFLGIQIIGGGLFQAIGKPLPALIITISKQLLFLIPAIISLPLFMGLDGVWLSIPVSDFLTFLVTAGWILKEMRLFKKISYRETCT